MRLDLKKSRYQNFDELYLYCYYVAGTVGLMSVPVMGIAPDSKASTESVYNAALALGVANQLTNILRDVGEEYVSTSFKKNCVYIYFLMLLLHTDSYPQLWYVTLAFRL